MKRQEISGTLGEEQKAELTSNATTRLTADRVCAVKTGTIDTSSVGATSARSIEAKQGEQRRKRCVSREGKRREPESPPSERADWKNALESARDVHTLVSVVLDAAIDSASLVARSEVLADPVVEDDASIRALLVDREGQLDGATLPVGFAPTEGSREDTVGFSRRASWKQRAETRKRGESEKGTSRLTRRLAGIDRRIERCIRRRWAVDEQRVHTC
jgi:hypothetical protein